MLCGGESDGLVEKLTSKQFSDFILMKSKLRMDDGCPLLRGVPQTYLTFRAGKQSLLFILTFSFNVTSRSSLSSTTP